MVGLYYAHSGLRYLILLMAFVTLGIFLVGLVKNQPFGKLHRIIGASFAGLLHTQVLLGLVLVVMGRYYPQLIGHMAMMICAAGVMQATLTINRRRPDPGMRLPLVGVVLALVLITAGIGAIGRTLFQTTPIAQG